MSSSGDFSIQNFQSLIENYEAALRDVTGELDSVQAEQKTLKKVLNENNQLRLELEKALAENSERKIEHKFDENDLIGNLKLQLKIAIEEKDQAIKLWQNAADVAEHLENELRIYQENTQGFIPKSRLTELKNSYEEKLNNLQTTVSQTRKQLEETINLKSKELSFKDKELTGTLQSHSNSFKIIKNLEDEVLSLQERLNETNGSKCQLEKNIRNKNEEIELLKIKLKEYRFKVEEALHVVEAALNEKDAALLREAETKEETTKLAQTLNEFIDETDEKIKNIKQDYETKLAQVKQALQTSQELVKVKEMEVENWTKKCTALEGELEKLKNNKIYMEDPGTSKVLVLEKNLENTFQKLLLSERQNIQLKSDLEAVKNDLEQMSHYYERDINVREAEKATLNKEIQKLKKELDENHLKISQSTETISDLNKKILEMDMNFKEQIDQTKSSFQQSCLERQDMETVHNQIVQELQSQLILQTEINKKWRNETKSMIKQLEKVISEMKSANAKMKQENKLLHERIKEGNMKMFEYRKFLEMISHDVSKITTITLPEISENTR